MCVCVVHVFAIESHSLEIAAEMKESNKSGGEKQGNYRYMSGKPYVKRQECSKSVTEINYQGTQHTFVVLKAVLGADMVKGQRENNHFYHLILCQDPPFLSMQCEIKWLLPENRLVCLCVCVYIRVCKVFSIYLRFP